MKLIHPPLLLVYGVWISLSEEASNLSEWTSKLDCQRSDSLGKFQNLEGENKPARNSLSYNWVYIWPSSSFSGHDDMCVDGFENRQRRTNFCEQLS